MAPVWIVARAEKASKGGEMLARAAWACYKRSRAPVVLGCESLSEWHTVVCPALPPPFVCLFVYYIDLFPST